MANQLSNLLRSNAETIKACCSTEHAAGMGVTDAAALNKAISDACSSPEGRELMESLGAKGSINRDSLTLSSGTIARAKGYKVSTGWNWAVKVNKLAKALLASLES